MLYFKIASVVLSKLKGFKKNKKERRRKKCLMIKIKINELDVSFSCIDKRTNII